MKRSKMILSAAAFLTGIAGVFAFKSNKFTGTPNIYTLTGTTYTQKLTTCQYPKQTSLESVCSTIPAGATNYFYYTTAHGYHSLPASTQVYTVTR